MHNFSSIANIIWDLDGTLYSFSKEMDKDCVTAAAKAAIELGFQGTQQQAERIALEGFRTAHNGLEIFTNEYGLPLSQLHHAYHLHISIDHLEPYHALILSLEESTHRHAVLTHGSTHWAHRVLTQRQLMSFFEEEHIVGMEQYAFQKKCSHTAPFEHVLNALGGAVPQHTAIVEDNERNLFVPHRMGMMTVLIRKERNMPAEKPDFVDYIVSSPEQFMGMIG